MSQHINVFFLFFFFASLAFDDLVLSQSFRGGLGGPDHMFIGLLLLFRRGSFLFSQCLRCFIDGPFVGNLSPDDATDVRVAIISLVQGRIPFQEPTRWVLLLNGLDDGLGDQQFGVFGAALVQRSVGFHQTTEPFVAGMLIRQATSTTKDILWLNIQFERESKTFPVEEGV
jgi:hypothetical protein